MAAGAGVDSCAAAPAVSRSKGREDDRARPALAGRSRQFSEIYTCNSMSYMLCDAGFNSTI